MTISFDLDDTIIPGTKRFPTERQNLIQRGFGLEKIREGTVQLLKDLKSEGHQILVYTTSYRSASYIRWLFFSYGIWLDGIINQRRHELILLTDGKLYSKYPPAFGIDVHIDDSIGVEMEGQRFGFKTIIVAENDMQWQDTVRDSLIALSIQT
ncbi:HAD family hydrolase [Nibribacter koreensis]|uniref:HAD superfamily, subfamily IIIB (Acid phosphatase) n=1 Tax=Nibribacter koreensis TaxID=1084519 RepID=A0ABP8F7S2_9BACT